MRTLSAEDDLRRTVLRGAEGKAFAAGADSPGFGIHRLDGR